MKKILPSLLLTLLLGTGCGPSIVVWKGSNLIFAVVFGLGLLAAGVLWFRDIMYGDKKPKNRQP